MQYRQFGRTGWQVSEIAFALEISAVKIEYS